MTDRSTNLSTPAETVGQWPETVVSNTERDNDLGPPLVLLLRDLGIKGTLNDENSAGNPTTAAKGTPVSVSIIEAGATAASEGSAALIAALVGATAVWGRGERLLEKRTYSEIVWLRAGWTASTRANANRTTGLPNSYGKTKALYEVT